MSDPVMVDAHGRDLWGHAARVESMSGWNAVGNGPWLHCTHDPGHVVVAFKTQPMPRWSAQFWLDYLAMVLWVFDVEAWYDVDTRRFLVLYEHEQHLGRVPVGVASLDGSRSVVFEDYARAWRAVSGGRDA